MEPRTSRNLFSVEMQGARLQTYGDWSAFLADGTRLVNFHLSQIAMDGEFEAGAEMHMLLLIKKTVENSISKRTEELQRQLGESGTCLDDFILTCGRYEANCRAALSLCSIKGLPTIEAEKLGREAMSYVADVAALLKLNLAEGEGNDEQCYWLTRFEKRWAYK